MSRTLTAVWRLRDALPPEWRRRGRRVVDGVLAPLGSIVRGEDTTGLVALTVDDGPDPHWTRPLLDLLREREVTATFFVLAHRALRYPEIVRETIEAGHEIGLHGFDHTRLTTLPLREVFARTRDARDIIEDITGRPLRFFRPPFGALSPGVFGAIRRLGLDVVVWSATPRDWEDGAPIEVAHRVLDVLRSGDVVLTHDGLEMPEGSALPTFDRTAMFTALLDGMNERGLRAVSLDQLLRSSRAVRSAWFRP